MLLLHACAARSAAAAAAAGEVFLETVTPMMFSREANPLMPALEWPSSWSGTFRTLSRVDFSVRRLSVMVRPLPDPGSSAATYDGPPETRRYCLLLATIAGKSPTSLPRGEREGSRESVSRVRESSSAAAVAELQV